jgi:hypothetical protein
MASKLADTANAWSAVSNKALLRQTYDFNASMLASLFNKRPMMPRGVMAAAMQACSLLSRDTPKAAQGRTAGHLVVAAIEAAACDPSRTPEVHFLRDGLSVCARSTARQADASFLSSDVLAKWLSDTLYELSLHAGRATEAEYLKSPSGALLLELLGRLSRADSRYLTEDLINSLRTSHESGPRDPQLAALVDACLATAAGSARGGSSWSLHDSDFAQQHRQDRSIAMLSPGPRTRPAEGDTFTYEQVQAFIHCRTADLNRELRQYAAAYRAEVRERQRLDRELQDVKELRASLSADSPGATP